MIDEIKRKQIELNLHHPVKGKLIDLRNESLSIPDYEWLSQIIIRSIFLKQIKFPKIDITDEDKVICLLNKATIKNSTLISLNIALSPMREQSTLWTQVKSRLERNKKNIFAIHGGGNIGLGLMADVISKSQMNYNIIATSNKTFFATLINSCNKLWLQHGSLNKDKTTTVDNISIVTREKNDVIDMYLQAGIVALCVTPVVLSQIAEDVAEALIARYKKDGSGLKILVLMNIPKCDQFVYAKIKDSLFQLAKDEEYIEKILSGIEFISTVIDRIVTPISDEEVTLQLKQQLLAHYKEDEIEGLIKTPQQLSKAVRDHQLKFNLFNAEEIFSIYVDEKFPEGHRFPAISKTNDLEVLEAVKNKYINGPHAILAWFGAFLGYKTVSEAINDPGIFNFINNLMTDEIGPTLFKEYPKLTDIELNSLKRNFFVRCRNSIDDLLIRVGRDPLRKLNRGARIRGTIELAQNHPLIATIGLELGVLLGMLYGIYQIDPDNPGCKKILKIYKENNQSLAALLSYSGKAPTGTFSGFKLDLDIVLIQRIIALASELEKFFVLGDGKRKLRSSSVLSLLKNKTEKNIRLHESKTILANYSLFLHSRMGITMESIVLQSKLKALGINVNIKTGQLYYDSTFNPIQLKCQLVFIRHSETFGNAGYCTYDGQIDYDLLNKTARNKDKRIYQGAVDTKINQLTPFGLQQAIVVADLLKIDLLDKGWVPDVILVSPLSRARDTASYFVVQNNFEKRCFIHEGLKEMSFGSWDNRRVCDLSIHDPCHLFYQRQNALVKNDGINGNGAYQKAENFCEVILRAYNVLMDIEKKYSNKQIVIFSHSMFGAACSILFGKGQTVENGRHLAFDGKRRDGTYYTMPHATPYLLNFEDMGFNNSCSNSVSIRT